MFVSDTNIFPSSQIKIRLTRADGTDVLVMFSPVATVDNLKVAALNSTLSDPAEIMKESLYYKVVLVRNCRALEDDKTLVEQGVQDNDEVLLFKRRLLPFQFEKGVDRTKAEEAKRGPTAAEILKATSSIVTSQLPATTATNIAATVDFQTDLHKILISLIEVSQRLLCLNPEASKIFQQAEEILNQPALEKTIDNNCVKQLQEMGFPENRAKKALLLNSMSVVSALEWLLQHQEDPDIDEPLQDDTPLENKGAVGRLDMDSSETRTSGETVPPGRVTDILKSLRTYRKREFKPIPKVLDELLEMGFDEADVLNALRVTKNNRNAACDMLINKKPIQNDVDVGIHPESPLFQAIMCNPVVQLGLNNPRCLLAFIQILEHPHTASQWLNDSELAPLLMQVSRIYHAEKQSEPQQIFEQEQLRRKKSK